MVINVQEVSHIEPENDFNTYGKVKNVLIISVVAHFFCKIIT